MGCRPVSFVATAQPVSDPVPHERAATSARERTRSTRLTLASIASGSTPGTECKAYSRWGSLQDGTASRRVVLSPHPPYAAIVTSSWSARPVVSSRLIRERTNRGDDWSSCLIAGTSLRVPRGRSD
jgi:hypothetical protein